MDINKSDFNYDEIIKAVEASPEDSTIYFGADSKQYSKAGTQYVSYVTVVVIHHASSKGAQLFRAWHIQKDTGDLWTRLMREVQDTIAVCEEVIPYVGDRFVEVHLDLNPNENYASSQVVKAAAGWVRGVLGIEPKLKPESFIASSVADRYAVTRAKNRRDSPAQKRKFQKQRRRARRSK